MNTTLAQHQTAMTQFLRNPDEVAAPANQERRPLNVYQELVFNNIESQLSSAFPVIESILSKEQWLEMVRAFIRDYRAETPYFPKLSAELVSFLSELESDVKGERKDNTLPPFILELAHYERIELDVFMMDEQHQHAELDEATLLSSPISLLSTAQLLAYAYPVHQISPELQPHEQPESPTLLLLFQDEQQEVRFIELQPLAFQLVAKLSENKDQAGTELLQMLAQELGLEFTETFQQQALQLLQHLNSLKVLTRVN